MRADGRRNGHARRHGHGRAAGFTLVEALIVVGIIALLTAMAAPSYRNYQTRLTSFALSDMLVNAMRMARSEAIARGVPVSVCALGSDNRSCDLSAAGVWDRGVVVVADLGRAGEQPVRIFETLDPSYQIRSADNLAQLTFTATGLPAGNGVWVAVNTFDIKRTGDSSSYTARRVCINRAGRVRTRESDGACSGD